VIASLVALLLAGEPELTRIVAWDVESKTVLIAHWHGISHEDPPPKELATNYDLYVDEQFASHVFCEGQRMQRDDDPEVPIKSCAREDLAAALKLGNQAKGGDLAEFRVVAKGKKFGEKTPLQRKTPKGWATVKTVETFVTPKITGVVHGEKVTMLVLEVTIPKAAFGIPSSREEAVFIPR
jgi:hypothetical protein